MNAIPSYLGLRGEPLVQAVNVVSAFSYLLFGYDNGVMSGIITAPQFIEVMKPMSTTMQGTVVSILEIGAFLGAMACVWLGEPWGRRKTCFWGGIIMLIGALLQAAAYERAMFIVGRVVNGIGLGLLTSTAPPYISECSSAAKRGRNVAIMLTALIVGINIAYWLNYGFNRIPTSVAWRVPLIFQAIFDITICVMCLILPDSPRWLYLKGRGEEGFKALQALRNMRNDNPELLRERDDILAAIALEKAHGSNWKAVFVDGGIRGNKRVALACMTLIFQQLTGTNILTYFSPVVYQQSVGLSRELSLLMGGFLQVWFLVASFVTWFTIDRFGRRPLFMLGYCGMGVTFLILMGMLFMPDSKSAGIVAIVMIFLYQSFFTWGTMATTWCYPSEILPLALRTKGSAYTAASSWIFGYMIVQVSPSGIDNLGKYFYLIWAAINFLMMAAVYFYYPETASMSLEAVDLIFVEDYKGWRSAVKKSKELHRLARAQRRRHLEPVNLHLTDANTASPMEGYTASRMEGVPKSTIEMKE